MNLVNYHEGDLPIKDLETIGLAAGGQLLLNIDDLKALFSGRRTGLMELHDLEAENIKIKSLNAKISLAPNEKGKLDLLIHPIYHRAVTPDFLDDNEAQQLQKAEVTSILKITTDKKGNKKEMLIEYDAETREYIVSDTEKILVPDMVNNEFLTPAQKEDYRKGKEVEIADGTRFNYSGVDHHGIRSNKLALVASILIDGGLSYMVYKGLNALFNKKRDPKVAEKLSPGYDNAIKDTQNDEILLRPAMLFAFLKALPLLTLAITFLLLAWWLSPYFIVFSIVVCGFAWYRLLYIRSFKYLVSIEYILITKGIFFKRIDQLEMFRVKDYIITQPFILQLCKLIHLTLKSTDEENKVVRFEGIPESAILETIRDRVLSARKNNNIYELN